MASVGNGRFEVDYSPADGRVRQFRIGLEIVYDEGRDINPHDWQARLSDVVVEWLLNVDRPEGRHAFVLAMIDAGLVPDG